VKICKVKYCITDTEYYSSTIRDSICLIGNQIVCHELYPKLYPK